MAHRPRHRHHGGDPVRRRGRTADRLRRDEDHQLRPWRLPHRRRLLGAAGHQARAGTRGGRSPFAFVIGVALRDGDRAARGAAALCPPARCDPRHLGSRHHHRPGHHARLRARGAVRRRARSPARSICSASPTRQYRLLLVVVAVVLAAALALVLNGTRLGLTTRAVIMNEDLARGLGINSGAGALRHLLAGRRARRPRRRADHAAVERRSQHGRALAGQRLHAGDGLRRVAR